MGAISGIAAPDILVRELSLVADLGSAPNRAPQPWDIQCTLDLCEFAWPYACATRTAVVAFTNSLQSIA